MRRLLSLVLALALLLSCAAAETAEPRNMEVSGIPKTKNGSFYDVDQGVEPDYFINDYANFYNREALTEFINGLF